MSKGRDITRPGIPHHVDENGGSGRIRIEMLKQDSESETTAISRLPKAFSTPTALWWLLALVLCVASGSAAFAWRAAAKMASMASQDQVGALQSQVSEDEKTQSSQEEHLKAHDEEFQRIDQTLNRMDDKLDRLLSGGR